MALFEGPMAGVAASRLKGPEGPALPRLETDGLGLEQRRDVLTMASAVLGAHALCPELEKFSRLIAGALEVKCSKFGRDITQHR